MQVALSLKFLVSPPGAHSQATTTAHVPSSTDWRGETHDHRKPNRVTRGPTGVLAKTYPPPVLSGLRYGLF